MTLGFKLVLRISILTLGWTNYNSNELLFNKFWDKTTPVY